MSKIKNWIKGYKAAAAIAVMLSLCMQTVVSAKAAEPTDEMPVPLAEQTIETADASASGEILREDTEKRGAYEKYFLHDNGAYTAVAYSVPVHMQRDGNWVDIDNRLEERVVDGERVLQNRDGLVDVTFSRTPQGERIGTMQYGEYSLSWRVSAVSDPVEQNFTIQKTAEEMVAARETAQRVTAALSNVKNPALQMGLQFLEPQEQALCAEAVAEVQPDGPEPEQEAERAVMHTASAVTYADALPAIDIAYSVLPAKVKEDIILQSPTDITSYHTEIEAPGLMPYLLKNRSVEFRNEAQEVIFTLPTPYMYDAKEVYSDDIVVELEMLDADTCKIIYIPNYDWLQAPERAYPVTVDPTYQSTPALYGPTVTQDTYASTVNPNTNYYTAPNLTVGRSFYSCLRFPQLPSLGSNYLIESARIVLYTQSTAAGNLDISRISTPWESSKVTWNNMPSSVGVVATNVTCQNQRYGNWDATSLVAGWYAGKYPNYGIGITASSSSGGSWSLCSSDHANANLQPYIQVHYYSMQDANLDTGTYFIGSYQNNRYLDATSGIAANGTNVETTSFHGNNSQQWYITNLGNGLYTIMSNIFTEHTRTHHLDVHGGGDISGSNVNLWNTPANRFRIMKDTYTKRTVIVPAFSNTRALDIYYGTDSSKYGKNVQLYDYSQSNNQLWSFEKLNDTVFYYLDSLDGCAQSYISIYGGQKERLIYNFIRSLRYNSTLWGVAAGGINQRFIDYALRMNSRLGFLRGPDLYLDDPDYGKIDFPHMAATADVYEAWGIDEGGWAGDLQTAVTQAKKNTGNSNNYTTFYNEMRRLIGSTNENFSDCSMTDVLADLDGKYIYEHPSSAKFGTRLRSYYASASRNRFSNFYPDYTWTELRDKAKTFTNDKRITGVRQPLYISGYYGNDYQTVSTVTENQALAAANAFADFIFKYR